MPLSCVSKLRFAVSVERAWENVFASRAAWVLGASSRVRRHARLTLKGRYVRLNVMWAARLRDALERLTGAIRDVESELAAMKAEQDR